MTSFSSSATNEFAGESATVCAVHVPQLDSLGLVTLSFYALPALDLITIAPNVLVTQRVLAVRTLEVDAQSLRVVDPLRPDERLRRIALLYPVYKGHQDVLFWFVAVNLAAALPDRMRAITTAAVAGARDKEVSIKLIELGWSFTHSSADVLVVPS